MKDSLKPLILSSAILLLILGVYLWREYGGARFAIQPVTSDIARDEDDAGGLPLQLPGEFFIEIAEKDIPGARDMAFDGFGNMVVSQTKEGIISLLTMEDGRVKESNVILRNLNNPHGVAFDPENPILLYFAEEDKISRIPLYSDGMAEKIVDLPKGGSHFTRTIRFGPDGRLYVAVGSSCNVCHQSDSNRAAVYSFNKDGGEKLEFARGLRNTVFFTWDEDGRMWGADMGRDHLGDNLPPDEVNVIDRDKNYGWPICYGKNVHDSAFDTRTYIRNPCMEPFEAGSKIDLPAHSAPLGIAFAPNSWPAAYRDDLIVALHGSWNSSVPVGYKVVRIPLNGEGNQDGEIVDFISGWLRSDGSLLGRPAGLAVYNGVMYITDDKAGVIYRVTLKP